MKITTKYDKDQIVFFLLDDKICSSPVLSILVDTDRTPIPTVVYRVYDNDGDYSSVRESDVYPSARAVAAALLKENYAGIPRAYIYFAGDPTVGIMPCFCEMDLPAFEEEFREETRELIAKFYQDLDGESAPQWVVFSDEPMD